MHKLHIVADIDPAHLPIQARDAALGMRVPRMLTQLGGDLSFAYNYDVPVRAPFHRMGHVCVYDHACLRARARAREYIYPRGVCVHVYMSPRVRGVWGRVCMCLGVRTRVCVPGCTYACVCAGVYVRA